MQQYEIELFYFRRLSEFSMNDYSMYLLSMYWEDPIMKLEREIAKYSKVLTVRCNSTMSVDTSHFDK